MTDSAGRTILKSVEGSGYQNASGLACQTCIWVMHPSVRLSPGSGFSFANHFRGRYQLPRRQRASATAGARKKNREWNSDSYRKSSCTFCNSETRHDLASRTHDFLAEIPGSEVYFWMLPTKILQTSLAGPDPIRDSVRVARWP